MCEHYGFTLPEDHRHFIASVDHDNCVLCLVEAEGPMTQEKVASYMGVTKERISQIEKAALTKIRGRLKFGLEDLIPDPLPSFTPKTVLQHGRSSIANYLDVRSQFSAEESPYPTWRSRCIAK